MSEQTHPSEHSVHPIGGHPVVPVKVYATVYFVLLALLVATVAIAVVNLGKLNIVAAMSIAVVKMLLVILYFMHVKYSTRLTWLWASAGFFWLVIMFSLTMGDYVTRHWLPVLGW